MKPISTNLTGKFWTQILNSIIPIQNLLFFICHRKDCWIALPRLEPKHGVRFGEQVVSEIKNWWDTIARHSKANIIQLNFVEINDAIFGHFASKVPFSFPFQIKKINYELMKLAQQQKHAFLADVAGLSNQAGYVNTHDARLYAMSKVAFALDFLPLVAKAMVDIIKATSGI